MRDARHLGGSGRRVPMSAQSRTRSVGEADPDRVDQLVIVAQAEPLVDKLQGAALLLELDTAVHSPAAELGGAAERHGAGAGDAEVPERVILVHRGRRRPDVVLVVVAHAETELDWHGDAALRRGVAGSNAEFEILPGLRSAIGLARIEVRIEFEGEQCVGLYRPLLEEGAVVLGNLEGDLLHGAEAVVRAGVRRERRPEAEAAAESETESRLEVRLVPQLSARTLGAAQTLMEAGPRAEVDAN